MSGIDPPPTVVPKEGSNKSRKKAEAITLFLRCGKCPNKFCLMQQLLPQLLTPASPPTLPSTASPAPADTPAPTLRARKRDRRGGSARTVTTPPAWAWSHDAVLGTVVHVTSSKHPYFLFEIRPILHSEEATELESTTPPPMQTSHLLDTDKQSAAPSNLALKDADEKSGHGKDRGAGVVERWVTLLDGATFRSSAVSCGIGHQSVTEYKRKLVLRDLEKETTRKLKLQGKETPHPEQKKTEVVQEKKKDTVEVVDESRRASPAPSAVPLLPLRRASKVVGAEAATGGEIGLSSPPPHVAAAAAVAGAGGSGSVLGTTTVANPERDETKLSEGNDEEADVEETDDEDQDEEKEEEEESGAASEEGGSSSGDDSTSSKSFHSAAPNPRCSFMPIQVQLKASKMKLQRVEGASQPCTERPNPDLGEPGPGRCDDVGDDGPTVNQGVNRRRVILPRLVLE